MALQLLAQGVVAQPLLEVCIRAVQGVGQTQEKQRAVKGKLASKPAQPVQSNAWAWAASTGRQSCCNCCRPLPVGTVALSSRSRSLAVLMEGENVKAPSRALPLCSGPTARRTHNQQHSNDARQNAQHAQQKTILSMAVFANARTPALLGRRAAAGCLNNCCVSRSAASCRDRWFSCGWKVRSASAKSCGAQCRGNKGNHGKGSRVHHLSARPDKLCMHKYQTALCPMTACCWRHWPSHTLRS